LHKGIIRLFRCKGVSLHTRASVFKTASATMALEPLRARTPCTMLLAVANVSNTLPLAVANMSNRIANKASIAGAHEALTLLNL
jgi:hypothetical protein